MTDAPSPAAPALGVPTAATVATTAAMAALSAWGSYAIVLIVLGWMYWRSQVEKASLRDENATLRAEIREQDRQRIEDAKQMTRVTEASTMLTTKRAEGDESFQTAFRDLASKVADLASKVATVTELVAIRDAPPPPRPPRRTR